MADPALSFTDFLERMKDPRAADLVRDIRAFVKSFDGRTPDPDRDSTAAQAFFEAQAAAFAAHPLWAGASPAVLDAAGEGLEKYTMTKIHGATFGVAPLDVERDGALALRLRGLAFVEPAHLDMPPGAVDERAVGLAGRELLKVNQFKAPRDKLVCILNCCRVLNNALAGAAAAAEKEKEKSRGGGGGTPGGGGGSGTTTTTTTPPLSSRAPGADDFLPALVYTLIKAAPPHLASNLEYVQRFRAAARLTGEAAYFFMQLYGAASFVETVNATSLSCDPGVFVARMAAAGVPDMQLLLLERGGGGRGGGGGEAAAAHVPAAAAAAALTTRGSGGGTTAPLPPSSSSAPPPPTPGTAAELEAEGVALVLAADADGSLGRQGRGGAHHAWLYKEPSDLSLGELPALLQAYKDAVLKAEAVCRAADARAVAWRRAQGAQQAQQAPLPSSDGGGGLASVSAEEAAPAVEAAPAGDSGDVEPALEALALGEDGTAAAAVTAPAEAVAAPPRREEPPSLI